MTRPTGCHNPWLLSASCHLFGENSLHSLPAPEWVTRKKSRGVPRTRLSKEFLKSSLLSSVFECRQVCLFRTAILESPANQHDATSDSGGGRVVCFLRSLPATSLCGFAEYGTSSDARARTPRPRIRPHAQPGRGNPGVCGGSFGLP